MKKIHKWRIYRANLDPITGSEQGGTRPVLVVSEDDLNDLLNCVNVLPITSRKPNRRVYSNEVLLPSGSANLPNESLVLAHQIRTVDKTRLSNAYGDISDSTLQTAIIDALCFQFGINS
jgi:mRNA interferase MazF